MADFLQYWKNGVSGELIDFAASSQFANRVQAGDTLWIVTLSAGKLVLLGDLQVQEVLSSQVFKRRRPDLNAYPASHIAVAGKHVTAAKEVPIQLLAPRLRFASTRDRFNFEKPLGNQLQTLRELTQESADLLSKTFTESAEKENTSANPELLTVDIDLSHQEGQIKFGLHMRRVRSPALINAKKLEVWRRLGKLRCEVCDFDFQAFYGAQYGDYFECHHLSPLGKQSEAVRNSVEDVILICSNCHTIAHKGLENHGRRALMKIRKDLRKRNVLFSALLT